MTFEQYIKLKNSLNSRLDKLSIILNSFPKDQNGLVNQAVRETPLYQEAKREYDIIFQQCRQFNSLPASKKYAQRQQREKRAALTK